MILEECKDVLDLSLKNTDGMTQYGTALKVYLNKGTASDNNFTAILKLMNTNYVYKGYHKSQMKIDDIEGLKTPIYSYITSTRPLDLKSMYDSPSWSICFPFKTFSLQTIPEVNELY